MEKDELDIRIDMLERDVTNIKRAFPKSSIGEIDYMGHREHHEHVISAARSQQKFWDELRSDLIRKGTWVVILIVLGLMANGILFKLGLAR